MELLTEHEAARAVKVSKWTIRRLIEKGKLRAANYGMGCKRYRIDPADLNAVQPFDLMPQEPRKRQRAIVDEGPVWKPKRRGQAAKA
jgi:excisionase family DNA binding protein